MKSHSMGRRPAASVIFAVAFLVAALVVAGCGDNGSGFEPEVEPLVTLSPDSTTIGPGGQIAFTATVTGLAGDGLAWYVNGEPGGGTIYGTITSEGVYSSPLIIPENPLVAVKAVSVADTSYYAEAKVLIVDNPGVTLSPATTAIKPRGQVTFTATVKGLGGDGLAWYVNGEAGGSVVDGTITADGIYSAPVFVPENPLVVVKAVSIADTNYYAQASVLIVAPLALELENFISTEGDGMYVTFCSGASGGQAVDGCDRAGKALIYDVTFEHPGYYSGILRAATYKLQHRLPRVTLFAAGPGGEDQVLDYDILGEGLT